MREETFHMTSFTWTCRYQVIFSLHHRLVNLMMSESIQFQIKAMEPAAQRESVETPLAVNPGSGPQKVTAAFNIWKITVVGGRFYISQSGSKRARFDILERRSFLSGRGHAGGGQR